MIHTVIPTFPRQGNNYHLNALQIPQTNDITTLIMKTTAQNIELKPYDIHSKFKRKIPDTDLTMTIESELGWAHLHSSSAKWTEQRLSSLHDGKCRAPSEGDQPRCRSTAENCKNEHRLNQVSHQNHYATTKAKKSERNLIIFIITSVIRNDSSN